MAGDLPQNSGKLLSKRHGQPGKGGQQNALNSARVAGDCRKRCLPCDGADFPCDCMHGDWDLFFLWPAAIRECALSCRPRLKECGPNYVLSGLRLQLMPHPVEAALDLLGGHSSYSHLLTLLFTCHSCRFGVSSLALGSWRLFGVALSCLWSSQYLSYHQHWHVLLPAPQPGLDGWHSAESMRTFLLESSLTVGLTWPTCVAHESQHTGRLQ